MKERHQKGRGEEKLLSEHILAIKNTDLNVNEFILTRKAQ
jgi:hypothetical protein